MKCFKCSKKRVKLRMARLVTHIPGRYEQTVRYYGYYSNKSRGMRKKAKTDDSIPAVIPNEMSSKGSRQSAGIDFIFLAFGGDSRLEPYFKLHHRCQSSFILSLTKTQGATGRYGKGRSVVSGQNMDEWMITHSHFN